MRKVRLEDKSEKSSDAFFEDANFGENAALSFANNSQITKLGKSGDLTDEYQSLISFLKQIFVFLPGTFLLFYMSFGAAIIFMEIVVFRREIQTLPDDYPFQFAFIGLIILLGTLMTWFGLGDLKNKKHFAIPASLMLTGAAFGAIVKIAAAWSKVADRMLDDFDYLVYLLPIALIVPVLTKSIVDRKTEDATNH